MVDIQWRRPADASQFSAGVKSARVALRWPSHCVTWPQRTRNFICKVVAQVAGSDPRRFSASLVKARRASREIEESSPNESGKSSGAHTRARRGARVCASPGRRRRAAVCTRAHHGAAYENESARRAPSGAEARSRSQWNSPVKLGHRVSQSAIRRERGRTRRALSTARPHDVRSGKRVAPNDITGP
ncbi:unnamed protein product, partial [Iphiclides podalirius]